MTNKWTDEALESEDPDFFDNCHPEFYKMNDFVIKPVKSLKSESYKNTDLKFKFRSDKPNDKKKKATSHLES